MKQLFATLRSMQPHTIYGACDEVKDFNLSGKDYFTETEAAHYACVSFSQFRRYADKHGILPIMFMGKKVYRKEDIRKAIETIRDVAVQHYPANDRARGARILPSSEKKRARPTPAPCEAEHQP